MAVDPLDELKRLAYGRGVDAAAAATAQTELARLDAARAEATRRAAEAARVEAEAARREAEPPQPPTAPEWPVPRASSRLFVGLTAAMLGAIVLAAGLPLVPERSLAALDRPQTARDLAAPEIAHGADPDTIRWLGALDEVTAYGYLNASGFVCVSLVGPGGLSGSCTSLSRFESAGIELVAIVGPVSGPVEVRWGPRGDVSLAYAPLTASG
jgi:hypothetical protein